MPQMAIEDTVEADVIALLTAGGLSAPIHRRGENLGQQPDYSAGRVAVGAQIRGSSLDAGQEPAGFFEVDLELVAETHVDIDATGTATGVLAAEVREIIEIEGLETALTATSATATYYHRRHGPSFRDDEGRIRRLVMTHTLTMRPSK